MTEMIPSWADMSVDVGFGDIDAGSTSTELVAHSFSEQAPAVWDASDPIHP